MGAHTEEKRGINWELLLTIGFYLFALASLVAFWGYREEYPRLFVYIGGVAVLLRIAYYIKRFFIN